MTLSVALDVETAGWHEVPDVTALVTGALRLAGERCGKTLAVDTEVSVLLCDDAAIRELNRDWRGSDKPTNVLSFPAVGPLATRPMLGDIAIAWETTQREAVTDGKAVRDYLTHLLVHGFLHLVGFDHGEDDEAEAMEGLETAILAELGIGDPYRFTDPAGQHVP